MFLKSGRVGAIVLLAFLFQGCGLIKMGERKELPVPLEISLRASERVNPAIDGRPSPVVVWVGELAGDTKFSSMSYDELITEEGRAALGSEVVAGQELILLPGQGHFVRSITDPRSRFVGVVAEYRDVAGSNWRAIVPLPAPWVEGRLVTRHKSPTTRLAVFLGQKGVKIRALQD